MLDIPEVEPALRVLHFFVTVFTVFCRFPDLVCYAAVCFLARSSASLATLAFSAFCCSFSNFFCSLSFFRFSFSSYSFFLFSSRSLRRAAHLSLVKTLAPETRFAVSFFLGAVQGTYCIKYFEIYLNTVLLEVAATVEPGPRGVPTGE